jgi:hypothetical protein
MAGGQDVVDVAVAAVPGQNREVGNDCVAVVAGRDHQPHWFPLRQCRDPPPVLRARVAREFVLVMSDRRFAHGHPGQIPTAMCIQRPVQNRGHQSQEFLGIVDRPEHKAPAWLGNPASPYAIPDAAVQRTAGHRSFPAPPCVLDGLPGHRALTPVGRDETAVLGRTAPDGEDLGHGGVHQSTVSPARRPNRSCSRAAIMAVPAARSFRSCR